MVCVPTPWAGQNSPPPLWDCVSQALLAQRKAQEACAPLFQERRGTAPQAPRSQAHSPANGFFCVSTPQITMAKLEENQAAQGLRARPLGQTGALLAPSATRAGHPRPPPSSHRREGGRRDVPHEGF